MKKNPLFLSWILLLCTILPTSLLAQQDGAFDPTFGSAGRLNIYISGSGDNVYSVILLPDGKIVFGGYANFEGVAGHGDIYIGKLLPDGTFDYTFGSGGSVSYDLGNNYSDVRDLALLPDGSIVYGGNKPGTYKGATMGRVAADGSTIVNPTGPTFVSTPINNEPTCMAYNRNADKVAVGGYVLSTTSYMFAHRFNTDGTADAGFSTDGTVYFGDTPMQDVTYGKAIAMLDDGSVLLAGKTSGNVFSIVKLRSDGSLDNTFGAATPPNGITTYAIGSPPLDGAEGMLVLPDGSIMVCGTSNSNFAIARFTSNGIYDNTFPSSTYNYNLNASATESFNSMVMQQDGKIIASGTSIFSGNPTGIIARYNTNGTLDTTFGNMGIIVLTNTELNSSVISTSEKRVLFAGQSAGQATLIKIKYGIQQYNIIGKDEVSIESEGTYQIHPVETGYTYNWSYNGTGILPLTAPNTSEIGLYFTKAATPGTLFCEVYDGGGNLIKIAKKDLTINTEQTLAELLADVQCDPAQTYADNSFINAFKFVRTDVESKDTGPSVTGYSDYTASSHYDTLFTGDNYQAELECVTNFGGVVYCGMWIDYNNNGKLTDDEFVGSSASEEKIFNINNIVIPTDAEEGPKRVRVRVRQSAPFMPYEACIPNEELSETEDYLIVLDSYDAIEAPNFITPNNDGKNDNFIVRGAKTDLNNSLKVFNRVGDLVYQKENYDNSWGGTADSGGQLKAGTYYFVFTQPNAEKKEDDIVKGYFEIRY